MRFLLVMMIKITHGVSDLSEKPWSTYNSFMDVFF